MKTARNTKIAKATNTKTINTTKATKNTETIINAKIANTKTINAKSTKIKNATKTTKTINTDKNAKFAKTTSALKALFSSTLVRYFGSAFAGLLVIISSRFFYELFFGFGVSVALSYISGHFVNFFISSRYIFSKDDTLSLKVAFVKFSFVACCGLVVQLIVANLALNFLQHATQLHFELQKFIAHICGIGTSFFANFMGHKFFSFKDNQIRQRLTKRTRQ